MSILEPLISKLTRFNLRSFVVYILEETKSEIEDYQIDQLRFGFDGTGKLISPEYRSDEYAAFKKTVLNGQAPLGTPDLKLTGSFQDKIMARITQQFLEITSMDIKTPDLEAKYGEDILKLSDSTFIRYFKDVFLPYAKDELKLIFNIK